MNTLGLDAKRCKEKTDYWLGIAETIPNQEELDEANEE